MLSPVKNEVSDGFILINNNDIDHLETKVTDPNIDLENINLSFTSTLSSNDKYEQNNDDNSSMQKSTSNFKMNSFANEMKCISQNVRSLKSKTLSN